MISVHPKLMQVLQEKRAPLRQCGMIFTPNVGRRGAEGGRRSICVCTIDTIVGALRNQV